MGQIKVLFSSKDGEKICLGDAFHQHKNTGDEPLW